jgi:hypothetical protein
MHNLEMSVHQALVYFGQMNIDEIIEKLKLRNIEASYDEVKQVCGVLINKRDIRVADYDSSVLVPVRQFGG